MSSASLVPPAPAFFAFVVFGDGVFPGSAVIFAAPGRPFAVAPIIAPGGLPVVGVLPVGATPLNARSGVSCAGVPAAAAAVGFFAAAPVAVTPGPPPLAVLFLALSVAVMTGFAVAAVVVGAVSGLSVFAAVGCFLESTPAAAVAVAVAVAVAAGAGALDFASAVLVSAPSVLFAAVPLAPLVAGGLFVPFTAGSSGAIGFTLLSSAAPPVPVPVPVVAVPAPSFLGVGGF